MNQRERFNLVYRDGRFFVGKFLVLYVRQNTDETICTGIVMGKKTGNSVKRNRFRRLVRENFRMYVENIRNGQDLVFVGRKVQTIPQFAQVKKEMYFLLKKMNVL